MNLTRRTLLLFALTVLIAIVGQWSAEPDGRSGSGCCRPRSCMLGLAFEGLRQRSLGIEAVAAAPARARLGRADRSRPDAGARRGRRPCASWPDVPGRHRDRGAHRHRGDGPGNRDDDACGPARQPRALALAGRCARVRAALSGSRGGRGASPCRARSRSSRTCAPTRGAAAALAAGGPAQRALVGSGSELHELREYRPRRSAALDRLEGERAPRPLDRARLLRRPAPRDHADARRRPHERHRDRPPDAPRPLRQCRLPLRGARGARTRIASASSPSPIARCSRSRPATACARPSACARASRTLRPSPRESNPLPAAARALSLCRQRALVILMLDLDDAGGQGQLGQAVRLLRPKHLPVVCGLLSPELFELQGARGAPLARSLRRRSRRPSRSRACARTQPRLRQLGAPVVLAPPAPVRGDGVRDLRPDARATARLSAGRTRRPCAGRARPSPPIIAISQHAMPMTARLANG